MLIMAIEAAKQVARKDREIAAYYIKEATFLSPIVLKPNPDGGDRIETMLHLRPILKPYEKESVWSDIWICTYHNGTWTECFRAIVQTQYRELRTQVDGGIELDLKQKSALEAYDHASNRCTSSISSDKFYSFCTDRGLVYGASFQILEDIRWDGQQTTVAYVNVSRPTAQYAGLVHPAIIDAGAQIFWTAPSLGLTESMPTEVPHRIYNTYISATAWKYPETTLVRIVTTSRYKSVGRGMVGSIMAFSDDGGLLAKVEKMEMDPIADDDKLGPIEKKLLYGIEWKPCIHTLNGSQLRVCCDSDSYPSGETQHGDYIRKLDRAVRQSLGSTYENLDGKDTTNTLPHFRHYISWMKRQIEQWPLSPRDHLDATAFEKLLVEVETAKPEWKMFAAVARSLPSIISGETDALSLLFSTTLAESFYGDIFKQLCDTKRFRTYIDLVSHDNPQLRILEIGAGTGGCTSHVLAALHRRELQTGGSCFVEYTYTDVSHGFFENAKVKFQHFAERMSFQTVDLEVDLLSQGIQISSYDMIIAGSVLHATKTLDSTLRNLHQVLKPNGKLVFFELTRPDALAMNFGFGILPGWWQSTETWRSQSPAINEDQWHNALRDAGFSGNDLVLRDFGSELCHNFSVIASSAKKRPEPRDLSCRVLLVVSQASATSDLDILAEAVAARLVETCDYSTQEVSWNQLPEAIVKPEDIVVFLPECIGSIFQAMDETVFNLLKATIQRAKRLLWVTATDVQNPLYPYSGITNGFLRAMRSENISKHIVTLVLDGVAYDHNLCASYVSTVFKAVFEQDSAEVEYVVRAGQLMTGRLVEEGKTNEIMHATLQPQLKSEPWGQGPGLIFTVRSPGTLDTLEFMPDDAYRPESELGDRELEVEAQAWGLNFRDIFMALGRLEENDYGFDCGGTVKRVGPNCTVRPGDKVIVAVIGCMRGFVKCHELEVIPLPESFTLEDAVSVTAPGITAYHSLVDTARLQKGERILIHSATGATGQVAVQIAQWIGAEIYVTVGTDEKKQFLMDTYNIPEARIFYSRNTSFAEGVMRVTHGEGVHVVLNSLSGDSLRASWECVAPYGRFVEMGKVDIRSNSGLAMSGFANNVSFTAVDLHHVSRTRKDITHHLLSSTMRLLQSGAIHCPSPVHIYRVSEMEQAFRFFQTGKNMGRIVISISASDMVPVRLLLRFLEVG
jgi:NADPH:quinone reductase-like Zn-dependent oxidoreductase/ubiquinone/menaquinone biosynthesis C-methylase UbiE